LPEINDSEVLAESENYFAWRSQEPGVGFIYHLELGGVTLHLMPDEWEEMLVLMRSVAE
jgi:hypothetical protein